MSTKSCAGTRRPGKLGIAIHLGRGGPRLTPYIGNSRMVATARWFGTVPAAEPALFHHQEGLVRLVYTRSKQILEFTLAIQPNSTVFVIMRFCAFRMGYEIGQWGAQPTPPHGMQQAT